MADAEAAAAVVASAECVHASRAAQAGLATLVVGMGEMEAVWVVQQVRQALRVAGLEEAGVKEAGMEGLRNRCTSSVLHSSRRRVRDPSSGS